MIGRVSNSGEINAKKKAHYILFSTKIKKSLLFMSQIKSSGVKYQEKKAIKQKKNIDLSYERAMFLTKCLSFTT